MLYLVGLGLADETDITVRGLEVVKKAERVYLEAYTSILLVDKEKLVSFPGFYACFSLQCFLLAKECPGSSVGSFLWTTCHCSRPRVGREWQR